jgi:hypothetical protein
MEPRANRLRVGAGPFIATISGSSIGEEAYFPRSFFTKVGNGMSPQPLLQ